MCRHRDGYAGASRSSCERIAIIKGKRRDHHARAARSSGMGIAMPIRGHREPRAAATQCVREGNAIVSRRHGDAHERRPRCLGASLTIPSGEDGDALSLPRSCSPGGIALPSHGSAKLVIPRRVALSSELRAAPLWLAEPCRGPREGEPWGSDCSLDGNAMPGPHESRCTVSGENAGTHTATYSAPSAMGEL
jgi:hypothetical protein